MDKTAKNVLATVGAIAVATSAPVLAAGIVIGVAASNPEKTKETVQNVVGRAEDMLAKAIASYKEKECSQDGKFDGEGEGACECDDKSGEEEVHIPCEELEPDSSWEEDVPVAEEEPAAEENGEEKNPRKEKLERLVQALLDLAE